MVEGGPNGKRAERVQAIGLTEVVTFLSVGPCRRLSPQDTCLLC